MLQKVRDNASGLIIKIILWGLVLSFVGTIFLVWGYGDEKGQEPVAKVGDRVISVSEYRKKYDAIAKQFAAGDSKEALRTADVQQKVIRELVFEKLQLEAAQKAGFTVSEEELKAQIAGNPDFQIDGVFDKRAYVGILRANGLTPSEFEKLMRDDIVVSKMLRLVSDNVQVTENSIRQEFEKNTRKINVRFVEIPASNYEEKVEVTDEKIADYYKSNKAIFREPEGRKIEYLFADPKNFEEGIEVSEAEQREYYETNKDKFHIEEKVSARHLIVKVPENASEAEVEELRKKTEGYLKEIRDGADFAEMAKKYSDGPSAREGGDLGKFGHGAMLPAFEEVAFSLKKGEVSEPVRTSFGWHLIQTYDKQEESTLEFDMVKEIIKTDIMGKQTQEASRNKLSSTVKGKNKQTNWNELAKKNGLGFGTGIAFPNRPLDFADDSDKLSKRAFEMKEGDSSAPILLSNGLYVLRVIEKVPPRDMELSEVKDRIKQLMIREESEKLASQEAVELLERLRDGSAKLAEEAVKLGLEMVETGYFNRKNPSPLLAQKPVILHSAFTLNPGEFEILPSVQSFFVVEQAGKLAPNVEEYKAERSEIRKALVSRKRFETLSGWRQRLWDEADSKGLIDIKPQML